MEHNIIIGILMLLIVKAGWIGYWCGKKDRTGELTSTTLELSTTKKTLVTSDSVRHNLNCMIGDLKGDLDYFSDQLQERNAQLREVREALELERIEVTKFKGDAAAWNQSKGLWATDQPNLIKHHIHRERFFRLGYPEHRL